MRAATSTRPSPGGRGRSATTSTPTRSSRRGSSSLVTQQSSASTHSTISPDFAPNVADGDFVVGGHNFGSGSSREHAPISLLGAGVDGIVAQSFARIFFRNGINLGLPVLICPDADQIDDGDEISLRLDEGAVVNHTTEERYDADPLPEFLQTLVDRGGLEPYTRAKLGTE